MDVSLLHQTLISNFDDTRLFSNEKTYMCANYSKIARLIYFRRSSVEHLYDNKSSLCESWDEYQIDLPKRELGHKMERCDL